MAAGGHPWLQEVIHKKQPSFQFPKKKTTMPRTCVHSEASILSISKFEVDFRIMITLVKLP